MQAYATYRFTFDRVYSPDSDQAEVYEHSAKRTVLSTLQVRHAFHIPLPYIIYKMRLCLCVPLAWTSKFAIMM